jgi:hypothetical protein
MSSGNPSSSRIAIPAARRWDRQLRSLGLDPTWYLLPLTLEFQTNDPAINSIWLPFRMDTCASVSMMPEHWAGQHGLRVTRCPGTLSLTSAAGPGTVFGQMTQQTRVIVQGDNAGPLEIDFFLCNTLRDYGVLSLRDLTRYYDTEIRGSRLIQLSTSIQVSSLPMLFLYRLP